MSKRRMATMAKKIMMLPLLKRKHNYGDIDYADDGLL